MQVAPCPDLRVIQAASQPLPAQSAKLWNNRRIRTSIKKEQAASW